MHTNNFNYRFISSLLDKNKKKNRKIINIYLINVRPSYIIV